MPSNKKFRITLDDNLTFIDIDSNAKNNLRETIIMELKYNKNEDKNASRITQHFPLRLNKSSKYVSGLYLIYN